MIQGLFALFKHQAPEDFDACVHNEFYYVNIKIRKLKKYTKNAKNNPHYIHIGYHVIGSCWCAHRGIYLIV